MLRPPTPQLPFIRSARQRLFKRPSIYNSKLSRLLDDGQERQGGGIQPGSPVRIAPIAPATLLVTASSTSEHTQAIENTNIQRTPPSNSWTPEKVRDERALPSREVKASEQPMQTITRRPANPRKRVMGTGVSSTITQGTSKQSVQLFATSPRKKPRFVAPARPPSHVDTASSSQREQLIVVLKTQSTRTNKSNVDFMKHSAAESVNTPPRKAVVKARSCTSCRQRHMACDKAQPTCGPCVKRSQGHSCVYQPFQEAQIRPVKSTSVSPRKKVARDDGLAGPDALDKAASITQNISDKTIHTQKKQSQSHAIARSNRAKRGGSIARKGSVSSTPPANPEEPSASLRPRVAKTRATAAISNNTTRRIRRAIPDTRDLDFDTFLKMKKKNPKF